MAYRELLPHPALRPYVDRFWLRTPDDLTVRAAGPVAPVRILPDGCIDILIDAESGAARLVGTMTRAVVRADVAQAYIVGVRFRPGGAVGFLNLPAALLTDAAVPVADAGVRWVPRVGAAGAHELPRVLEALERALLGQLDRVDMDPQIRYATRRLLDLHAPSVAELARELRYSRQHLARCFHQHVGISPKQFERVARLQRAVDHVQRHPATRLAGAALDLGYYDQAHMSREFQDLAGVTPIEAQRATSSIYPIRSLWLEA